DPWKNDYIYHSPGEQNRPFEITSLGADGKEGGEGPNRDIHSWE
ncbi:MAG: type II secretion system protein GspG, partial [Betaproteobacteria bacterium]|nr:type II secretion system protein GspG [Betaproteobacteria bacterium]